MRVLLPWMQFLRKIFEDEDDDEKARSERSDQELALAKAVDAMAMGLECGIIESAAEALKLASCSSDDDDSASSARGKDYRKMAVLFMLLSACVADVNMAEEGMGSPRVTKGYDARHRVALRLLATWLNVKWGKMVSPLRHAAIDSPLPRDSIVASRRVQLCDWTSWHCRKLSR
jgi:hypothetical protein